MSGTLIRACAVSELPDGGALRIDGPVPVALFNAAGDFYAVDDTCPHQEASLSYGYVDGLIVECPLHASCFDLRTGAVTGPPAKVGVRTYPVQVRAGQVYVDIPAVLGVA